MEAKRQPMRVLIVDDDPPSLKMTAFLLSEEGYEVVTADNGLDALRLQRIRRNMSLPIIMLSAKGETVDRVQGLDVGADDYLAKPFEPSELLARVRSVLRRSDAFALSEPQASLSVGGLLLDPITNMVHLSDGTKTELTPLEFRLLHCLMRNPGRTLTHDQIISHVWGYDYDGYANQIAVYVRRLRVKIEADPDDPRYVQTVRGLGYKFMAE